MTPLSFKQLQELPAGDLYARFEAGITADQLEDFKFTELDFPSMTGLVSSLCLLLVFGDTRTKIFARQRILKLTGCSQVVHTKKGG